MIYFGRSDTDRSVVCSFIFLYQPLIKSPRCGPTVESCTGLKRCAARVHIFAPFYRLPGARERDGGVGLGLSLVRQIAHRHGGEVECLGRASGSSCFVATLPK